MRADGLFDISRLRLSEIHRVEKNHIRATAKGVASKGESHALNRIFFPPPPHPPPPFTTPPPPRTPPSLETGWGGLQGTGRKVEGCVVRVGWCDGSHLSSGNPDRPLVRSNVDRPCPSPWSEHAAVT